MIGSRISVLSFFRFESPLIFRLTFHLSTEAQINMYFIAKGPRKGLPLVASIKIPENLWFST